MALRRDADMGEERILLKLSQAKVRERQRIQDGAEAVVAGWQCFLEGMLVRLETYLVAGRIVTFQSVTPEERAFFEDLSAKVELPEGACALFLPASVRQAMMFTPDSGPWRPAAGSMAADSGSLIASRCGDYALILNSHLAQPPYAAGIDVYDNGRLLAGYSYASVAECLASLQQVIWTYLAVRS
jgi:hypothetical protein